MAINNEYFTPKNSRQECDGYCSGAMRYDDNNHPRWVLVTDDEKTGAREVSCSSLRDRKCVPVNLTLNGIPSSGEQILPCVLLVDSATRA